MHYHHINIAAHQHKKEVMFDPDIQRETRKCNPGDLTGVTVQGGKLIGAGQESAWVGVVAKSEKRVKAGLVLWQPNTVKRKAQPNGERPETPRAEIVCRVAIRWESRLTERLSASALSRDKICTWGHLGDAQKEDGFNSQYSNVLSGNRPLGVLRDITEIPNRSASFKIIHVPILHCTWRDAKSTFHVDNHEVASRMVV